MNGTCVVKHAVETTLVYIVLPASGLLLYAVFYWVDLNGNEAFMYVSFSTALYAKLLPLRSTLLLHSHTSHERL